MIESLIKNISQIDLSVMLDFYRNIENSIVWSNFDKKGKQAGLQFFSGIDYWSNATDRVNVPSRKFLNMNPFFKSSPFEEVINKFQMKRSRLMWLDSWSCYTFHKDDSPRIHIPLITNSNAYILFRSGLIYHLSPGSVYWVNTKEEHSAMNGSEEPRLHLVGCVEY